MMMEMTAAVRSMKKCEKFMGRCTLRRGRRADRSSSAVTSLAPGRARQPVDNDAVVGGDAAADDEAVVGDRSKFSQASARPCRRR